MLAPDFVSHTKLVAGQQPGREGEKWAIAQLTAALSNRSIHFEDQVAAGDKVVSRFTVHETHDRGELMGVAPSGRAMTNKTIMIHRISEILGHSNIALTLDTCSHVLPNMQDSAARSKKPSADAL
jgi:predicted ester cyclase